MLFLAMLLLGATIGFVGAGGAGVTIAMLTAGFNVPIHTALAVSLASMVFTTLSGALSHYREKEVVVPTGRVIGTSGIVGALLGTVVSDHMQPGSLSLMTGIMLFLSAVLLYVRLYQDRWLNEHFPVRQTLLTGRKLYLYGIPTGVLSGFISGAFGIGSAAFIQLALMVIFGVPLIEAIGTCMLIILPISAAGGFGYFLSGHLEPYIFLQTLFGMMIGAYFGAKLTHLAPVPVLRVFVVGLPAVGAIVMMIFD